jgi:hypothetical protein
MLCIIPKVYCYATCDSQQVMSHGARSFRGGNCVSHSEQVDARVGRGFVVKVFAWIITRDKV